MSPELGEDFQSDWKDLVRKGIEGRSLVASEVEVSVEVAVSSSVVLMDREVAGILVPFLPVAADAPRGPLAIFFGAEKASVVAMDAVARMPAVVASSADTVAENETIVDGCIDGRMDEWMDGWVLSAE